MKNKKLFIYFSQPTTDNLQLIILFLLCIVSRLFTTIYYIADPDSLRFALAIQEYDLVKLQPHFPGYPVFCCLAKILLILFERFSITFSIIGGIATFIIIWSLLQINKLLKLDIYPILISILVFFNPLIWIMGNRYMPDLMGLSLCLLTFHFFIQSYINTNKTSILLFIFSIGLLSGIRLSYLPLLIIPGIYSILFFPYKKLQLLTAIISVLVWFIPMLIDTGWNNLIEVATVQSNGHFYEWGGTIIAEPDYLQRFFSLLRNILADGMGAYWTGRNYLTIVPMLIVLLSIPYAIHIHVSEQNNKKLYRLIIVSFFIYAIWIFFFQNIMYQSRHVLPLVILCIFLIALGLNQFIKNISKNNTFNSQLLRGEGNVFKNFVSFIDVLKKGNLTIIPVTLALLIQMGITLKLVRQQQLPTAIAQTTDYLKSVVNNSTLIITNPLMQDYFEHSGIKANYIHAADSTRYAYKNYSQLIFIANTTTFTNSIVDKKTFYHNPYINRVWPIITVQLE